MSYTITICETGKYENGFTATVGFSSEGNLYEINISDSFSHKEKDILKWYPKNRSSSVFVDQIKSQETVESIRSYGEQLFTQVFRENLEIYAAYHHHSMSDTTINIVGSPEFQTLHWEAMRETKNRRPLAVEMTVVRKSHKQSPIQWENTQPASHLNVLLITARPEGIGEFNLSPISQPLFDDLEIRSLDVRIDMVRPGTFEALYKHLESVRDKKGDGYYHIIHFDMYQGLLSYDQCKSCCSKGPQYSDNTFNETSCWEETAPYEGYQPFLFFNAENNESSCNSNPVSAENLASLLNMRKIPIAILNTCPSSNKMDNGNILFAGQLIEAGVPQVLSMDHSDPVTSNTVLITVLYRELINGEDMANATQRGRLELYNSKERLAGFGEAIQQEDWLLPVFFQSTSLKLDISFIEENRGEDKDGEVEKKDLTPYEFAGRDVDILQIEHRLFNESNLLFIYGAAGVGKTRLLHYLSTWWKKTGFIKGFFYFSYDEKRYDLSQIIQSIGMSLSLSLTGRIEDDRLCVLESLKDKRYLLILDHVESVTGDGVKTSHGLSEKDQAEMKVFFNGLINTTTLVLFGTRTPEGWSQSLSLDSSTEYTLKGLDETSQKRLARNILNTGNAPPYYEKAEYQEDFVNLLKCLNGYPMAMTLILSLLSKETPGNILKHLQTMDITFEETSGDDKIRANMYQFIQFAFSDLSLDDKTPLISLTPFSSVIQKSDFEKYRQLLKVKPALARYDFDQWDNDFEEVLRAGLIYPHWEHRGLGYFSIQPLFQQFLKLKWQDGYSNEEKEAIQTSFCQHYQRQAEQYHSLYHSSNHQDSELGRLFIKRNDSNLLKALTLSLERFESIVSLFRSLSSIYTHEQGYEKGLELSEKTFSQLLDYPFNQKKDDYWDALLLVTDQMGHFNFRLKRFEEAENSYHLMLQTQKTRRMIHDQAFTMHRLGNISYLCGKKEKSERYYKDALGINEVYDDGKGQAADLFQLGLLLKEQERWDEAIGYFNGALQLFEQENDHPMKADTPKISGGLFHSQNQFKEAKDCYTEAEKIYLTDDGDRFEEEITACRKFITEMEEQVNETFSETPEPMHGIPHPLKKWKQMEDEYSHLLKDLNGSVQALTRAAVLNQLGRALYEQGNFKAARKCYDDALEIKREAGTPMDRSSTIHNLGMLAQAQREWAEARRLYNQALQLKIQYGKRVDEASTLHQLGLLYHEQRRWDEAKLYYSDALKIKKESPCDYERAATLHQLGRLAEDQGDFEGAADFVFQAVFIYSEHNDSKLLICLKLLTRIQNERGVGEVPYRLSQVLGMEKNVAAELLSLISGTETTRMN